MSSRLNPHILKAVQQLTEDDIEARKFIEEMLFEEHLHPGQWWFKEYYKKKIKTYSRQWRGKNED